MKENPNKLKIAFEHIKNGVLEVKESGEILKLKTITAQGSTKDIKPRKATRKLKNGYLSVSFWKNNKQYTVYAHRLAWSYFNGPIPAGFDINHRNGNKEDNRLDNLEIATRGQNIRHAYRKKLRKPRLKRLGTNKIARAIELREQGLSYSQIASRLAMSQTSAFRAVKGLLPNSQALVKANVTLKEIQERKVG